MSLEAILIVLAAVAVLITPFIGVLLFLINRHRGG
jgi:hypothetical protein